MKKTILRLSTIGLLGLALTSCSSLMSSDDSVNDLPPAESASEVTINEPVKADVTRTTGLGDNESIQTITTTDNAPDYDNADEQLAIHASQASFDAEKPPVAKKPNPLLDGRYLPHNDRFYFRFDSSVIASEAVARLKVIAKFLAEHPRSQILLAGNTDERGSREYNVALGERRAKSVAEALRVAGIKPKQLRLISYGQEKPIAFGHNEKSWRMNRRVDLSFEVVG